MYSRSSENQFKNYMKGEGKAIGYFSSGKLIAQGFFTMPEYKKNNLGYDLNFCDSDLKKVAHLESLVVHPSFRGNNLQLLISKKIEHFAVKNKCKFLCLTVHPENEFSLNNFISLGFTIKMEKIKYSNLRRYILCKDI